MDEAHKKAQATREAYAMRKAQADAETAEYKAQIMAVLAAVGKDPEASVEQKLEAARLAVQLQGRGY